MRVCVSPYISEGGPENAAVHVDLQVQGKRSLGKETKMRVSSRNVRVTKILLVQSFAVAVFFLSLRTS